MILGSVGRNTANTGAASDYFLHKPYDYQVKLSCQVRSTAVLSLALVCGVILEEGALSIQGAADRLFGVDVTLTAVNNRDVAETKGNNAASQNIDDIGTSIPMK